MKVKYFIIALCLAAFAAGCQKTDDGKSGSKGGLRITADTRSPQGRTSIADDGITFKWQESDKVRIGMVSGVTEYDLKIDPASISSDGTKADFVLDGPFNPDHAGDYRIFYTQDGGPDFTNMGFNYDYAITTTWANRGTSSGGLRNINMYSEKINIKGDETKVTAPMRHASALIELTVTLKSNTTGSPVTLNSFTVADKNADQVFANIAYTNKSTGEITFSNEKSAQAKVTYSDTPELTVNTPYKLYVAVPPTVIGQALITVSTSAGDFTFEKSAKTLVIGKTYQITGLDLNAAPPVPVNNIADWNNAVKAATAPIAIDLKAPVELGTGDAVPTVPVTLMGSNTLTINVGELSSVPVSAPIFKAKATSADVVVPSENPTLTMPGISLKDGAKLTISGGNLYSTDVYMGEGSQITGVGLSRLVLSGNLTVGGQVYINGITASCNTLLNNGTMTLEGDGVLYYGAAKGNSAPAGAINKADAQLKYSNFDNWYTMEVKAFTIAKGTADMIGESKDIFSPWGSGNGAQNGTGGTAVLKCNPTTPEEAHVIKGKALKMFSKYVEAKVVITVKKFVAGNLFTGKLTGVAMDQSASMDFGVSHAYRPVALTGYYDYTSGLINYRDNVKVDTPTDPDYCDLYVVLSKKVYAVNTNKLDSYPGGATGDFKNDENIVAYGRWSSKETTNGYKSFRVELTYKDNYNPSDQLYLIATASCSKDGGSFTGSEQSMMYLDEVQLEY